MQSSTNASHISCFALREQLLPTGKVNRLSRAKLQNLDQYYTDTKVLFKTDIQVFQKMLFMLYGAQIRET